MNQEQIERLLSALEDINKNLSSFAEETKADKEARFKMSKSFNELEKEIFELRKNPFGLSVK